MENFLIKFMGINDLTPEKVPEIISEIFGEYGKLEKEIIKKLIEKKAFLKNIDQLKKSLITNKDVLVTQRDFEYTSTTVRKAIRKLINTGLIREEYISFKNINDNQNEVIKFYYFPYDSLYDLWDKTKRDINYYIEKYNNYFKEMNKYY